MSTAPLESGTYDWRQTKLWQLLEQTDKPEAEPVRTTLQVWLPTIQKILNQGGTAPLDFTLHDAEHSFRVAERMVDVIPDDVLAELSTYELALLLLSAYLHDIGMTPGQSLLRSHHDYLLTGDRQGLDQAQIDTFQTWLDDWNEDITIPLAEGTPTPATLCKAQLLITHYCRARHVDWSEKWIDDNFTEQKQKLGSYAQWIEDLKTLCRSHHQGYAELMETRFDPKPVGSAGMVVHLRYLAAVLRVADILEFDPERTPEVVFQHRAVSPGSAIYWYKDHSVTSLFDNRRLTISAESPDARIHRAIEIMTDDIEAELQLVRRIDDEKRFEIANFQEEPLPHQWNILPDVRRNIRPRHDAYEYIDGAFRPDTQKLLQLLSGKELYGDEMVAIRELLQNAFDAVREQIAYERLNRQHPGDPKWEERLGDIHEVEVRLEFDGDEIWLVCTDDGVGMTKAIIRDYLLVSGNAHHRDVRLLERRCRKAGFELGRTGQFGIGVLSYFMIADQVQIRTRRSGLAGDAELTGWSFETEGIGSFGELRKDQGWRQGTQVRLRLSQQGIQALGKSQYDSFETEFSESLETPHGNLQDHMRVRLADYLNDTLRYVPCNVRLTTNLSKGALLTLNPGWTREPGDLSGIWSDIGELMSRSTARQNTEDELLPARLREEHEAKRQKDEEEWASYKSLPHEIQSCLTWETVVGSLPNNLGSFRIHIPVFKLEGGHSHFFARLAKDDGQISIRLLGGCHFYIPQAKLYMSWKGMALDSNSAPFVRYSYVRSIFENPLKNAIVEIDWHSMEVGVLSVSREKIILSEVGKEALDWLQLPIRTKIEEFISKNQDSPFVQLSQLLAAEDPSIVTKDTWLSLNPSQDRGGKWEAVQFPAIDRCSIFRSHLFDIDKLYWKGERVHQLMPIQLFQAERWSSMGDAYILSWSKSNYFADRLVKLRHSEGSIVVELWLRKPAWGNAGYFGDVKSTFPPSWARLAYVTINPQWTETRYIGNRDHPIGQAADPNVETWIKQAFGEFPWISKLDPRPHRDALLAEREKAIGWLARVLQQPNKDFWDALTEQEGAFLREVWQLIFASTQPSPIETPIYSLHQALFSVSQRPARSVLWILTPASCEVIDDPAEIEKYLPDPGPEWTLAVVERDEQE
ncbi:MAG TPA: hypothetical protein VFZ66_07720 [Herpetosiphonaceae bacterium]